MRIGGRRKSISKAGRFDGMSTTPERLDLSGLSRAELLALVEQTEARRQADYERQVKAMGVLLARRGRTDEGRRSLLADMMTNLRITRAEARTLLGRAEAWLLDQEAKGLVPDLS